MTTLSVEISETLALDASTPLTWMLESAAGAKLRSATSPIAQMPAAQRVRLILPASVVMLTRVKLPAGRPQKIRQLLRYAVEDKVMADPETLHVASVSENSTEFAVAVVDRSWLKSVIDIFRGYGLAPRVALAETLLPKLEQAAWAAVWDGKQGFVRTGEYDGLAFDGGSQTEPPLALRLACDEARDNNAAPAELVLYTRAGALQPDLAAWSEVLGLKVHYAGAWSALAQASKSGEHFNLLQGEFAPASFRADWLPKLKPMAYLAAAIVIIQFGASALDLLMQRHEKNQLQQAMNSKYKATFPETRAVIDAPRQMQSQLQTLRRQAGEASPDDLVPMIARMTPRLDRSVRLSLLDYSPGLLKVDVILPAPDMAEPVRSQLQSDGLSVELESLTTVAGGTTARYILRAPNI